MDKETKKKCSCAAKKGTTAELAEKLKGKKGHKEAPEHHEENLEALEHPSYKALEEKLTEMETKANEYWNKLLRVQAELENTCRRSERDVSNAHKFGLEKFVKELIPIVDGIEKGLETEVGDNEFAKRMHEGLELSLSMFLNVLEKFGVEVINPVGEFFNPEFHEAMTTQEHPDYENNAVVKVLQKGYLLNQRLVRPALVIVAKGHC